MLERHRELAALHGHQADRVVAQARELREHVQGLGAGAGETERRSGPAVTPAIISLNARPSWTAARSSRNSAQPWHGRNVPTPKCGRSSSAGPRLVGSFAKSIIPARAPQCTTAVMVGMEREIVARMREGNQRGHSNPMLAEFPGRAL